MSLDGDAGGANTFVDDELRNWGKRRFGRFGVSGNWEIQDIRKTDRFEEIWKFPNEGKTSWNPGEVGRLENSG